MDPRSALSTPGAGVQRPVPPLPNQQRPVSVPSSPRAGKWVGTSQSAVATPRDDGGAAASTSSDLMSLVRELAQGEDGQKLPSFRKSPKNQKQVWSAFMAARERRERDLLIQQQRFIRELDTDVCASVRRMEIRVISLRWVLETRPSQMLRRQELEVLDANCSRRAPGIARPFMPAELAAVALRRSERRILVLSLPWLQEDNPDPLGFRASQIIAFAERFARRLGIRDDPEQLEKYGIFEAYGCMFQHPRTEREEAIFKRAVNEMPALYASAMGTSVCIFDPIPENPSSIGTVRIRVSKQTHHKPNEKSRLEVEIEGFEDLTRTMRKFGHVLDVHHTGSATKAKRPHSPPMHSPGKGRGASVSGKQPASPLSVTSPLTSQPPAADAQQQSKLMQRQADALFMEQLDHAITEMTKWTFYDHNGHTPRPGRATSPKGSRPDAKPQQAVEPKRFEVKYTSQEEAQRCVDQVPNEPTSHYVYQAFHGYNSCPLNRRGSGVLEASLALEVSSRARAFYPQVDTWLKSLSVAKVYRVDESGKTSEVTLDKPRQKRQVIKEIETGRYSFAQDRPKAVTLYNVYMKRINGAFEKAEGTREHALIEASKGTGEIAEAARRELVDHRKRVKLLYGDAIPAFSKKKGSASRLTTPR